MWWSTDVRKWDIGGREFENVGVGWATVCRDGDNESDTNEDSESIISVADFTTFLIKAKLFAKHHGKTSLLGTVMELDDKFTNDFFSFY